MTRLKNSQELWSSQRVQRDAYKQTGLSLNENRAKDTFGEWKTTVALQIDAGKAS